MNSKTHSFSTVNGKPKYFIYARKSSESEERQARSIEDQLGIMWKTAQQSQFDVIAEFTESRTARKPGRPVFTEMIERIEAGEADGILAWHPDRLARNAVDGGQIMYLLDTGKLNTLTFANFWFENTPQGKYMLNLAFAQSKYYTDNLSENIRRGIKSRLDRGVYPNWAKRGYTNHPKTREIIPDPKTFHLIREMFELYASGKESLLSLGVTMFEKGLTGNTEHPLSASQVQRMLQDTFYYGAFRYKDELYQGCHQAAIGKDLFDRAQAVMFNKGKCKTRKRNRHDFAFTGMLKCDECGHAVTAEITKGHTYYHCTKRSRIHDCRQPFVREEVLVSELASVLDAIPLTDDWVEKMLAEIDSLAQVHVSGTSAESRRVDLAFASIQSKLARLADLYVEGELDRADYLARKDRLLNEKIALMERRKLIAQDTGGMKLERMKKPLSVLLDWRKRKAGVDLIELRNFVAEVGSNLRLNSRKVLWDWNSPFALLAQGGSYTSWRREWDSNPRRGQAANRFSRPTPSASRPPLRSRESIITAH